MKLHIFYFIFDGRFNFFWYCDKFINLYEMFMIYFFSLDWMIGFITSKVGNIFQWRLIKCVFFQNEHLRMKYRTMHVHTYVYILIKITSLCFLSWCRLCTNVLQTLLTSFNDLVFGILKRLCKSNVGGERGLSPIALEKEEVPILMEDK